jgi:hypothetical protein
MRLLDPDHPFFRARWRRWATVLVPGAWAMVEFWRAEFLWGTIFAVLSAYAARVLLGPPPRPRDGGDG